MPVNKLTIVVDLERGEPEAVSLIQRMVNFGLLKETDTVRLEDSSRKGRGSVCWTVKDFLNR